jgi:hypothetical protein
MQARFDSRKAAADDSDFAARDAFGLKVRVQDMAGVLYALSFGATGTPPVAMIIWSGSSSPISP